MPGYRCWALGRKMHSHGSGEIPIMSVNIDLKTISSNQLNKSIRGHSITRFRHVFISLSTTALPFKTPGMGPKAYESTRVRLR
jgi:hypothetical protein